MGSNELLPQSVSQSAEYLPNEGPKLVWNVKKLQGGSEVNLKSRITLATPIGENQSIQKEIGPVSMTFEIPMYNVSKLQVRYLRIAEKHKSYNPYRWVRYVTQSQSYVCRF